MTHEISRRQFIQVGVAGGLAVSLAPYLRAAPARRRPNVLILTTDQQRVDAMSAAGNRWARTPAMDSIAARGVSFTQSYCPYPLCSPSRGALHTSRTPHEIQVDHNRMAIAPSIPISGQLFAAAGYDTGYAGKWHLPDPYPTDGIPGYEVLNRTSRSRKLAHDVDESTMAVAIDFLHRKRAKPFLLVASFINPHDICLLAGESKALAGDVWSRYAPGAGAELPPLPANFALTANARGGANTQLRHPDWDEWHWRRYRYAYYRLLEDVDRQVGKILEALRASGAEDDTLVIFTSDHGEGLGGHHWTGKMNFYDDEAAVPLVVSWKGVTPAGRIDQDHLVTGLDVLPTICDYAGVPAPAIMRGESLRGVIEQPSAPGRAFVVSEMAGGQGGRGAGAGRSFMVRSKPYTYMAFHGPQTDEMFFDVRSDPGGMKNLGDAAAVAAAVDAHRAMLADWKKATGLAQDPVQPSPKARRRAKRNGAGAA